MPGESCKALYPQSHTYIKGLCLVPPQAPLTDSEENTPVPQLLMPPPHYCKDSSILLWVGLLCRLSLALHKYKYKYKYKCKVGIRVSQKNSTMYIILWMGWPSMSVDTGITQTTKQTKLQTHLCHGVYRHCTTANSRAFCPVGGWAFYFN